MEIFAALEFDIQVTRQWTNDFLSLESMKPSDETSDI